MADPLVLNMNDMLTQYEIAKRISMDEALIVEYLNVLNDMGLDTPHIPCNRGEIHEYFMRDSYPEAEPVAYGMGVGSAATQYTGGTEGLTMLALESRVDARLADASPDIAKIRGLESSGILKSMGRQKAFISIYGDKNKSPLLIDGLYTRYKTAANPYVRKFKKKQAGGGFTDWAQSDGPFTSIYIAAPGREYFHYIHSSSSGSGITHKDLGKVYVTNLPRFKSKANDGSGQMYVTSYEMQFGLCIEHKDSVFRIANIPTGAGKLDASDRERLIDMVLETQDYLPVGAATKVLYGNIAVKQLVEKAGREKQVVVFTEKDPWGNPVSLINGMRVRRMDVIKSDDSEYVS